MGDDRTGGGLEPRTIDDLSDEEMGRVADFMQFLSERNRLYLFEYLRDGASEYILTQALANEPNEIMKKRTLERHLEDFEERGLIKKEEGPETNPHTGEEKQVEQFVLTPLGRELTPMFPDFVTATSTIDTLSWVLGQLPPGYWKQREKERFISKFQDATVTLDKPGNHQAREVYKNKVLGTVLDEDGTELGEDERVSEVKEIATKGVVSPGDGILAGWSAFHVPIMEHGLQATFIHSKSLVTKLEERDDWRQEAYDHQRVGVAEGEDPPVDQRQVTYYELNHDVPITLTIFGERGVGIFITIQENRGAFLYSESPDAIEWAESQFKRHLSESEPKKYRQPL